MLFTLENLDKFGALKAIGAKGRELVGMILFQAAITAFAGYGLGIGLCAVLIALAKLKVPGLRLDHHLRKPRVRAGHGASSSPRFSSYIAVRRVLKIEPFDIFRG